MSRLFSPTLVIKVLFHLHSLLSERALVSTSLGTRPGSGPGPGPGSGVVPGVAQEEGAAM